MMIDLASDLSAVGWIKGTLADVDVVIIEGVMDRGVAVVELSEKICAASEMAFSRMIACLVIAQMLVVMIPL